MVIHPQARTTPQLRTEIKNQKGSSQVVLAEQYNVTAQTIRKWQKREDVVDRSHRPHRLQTTLSPSQEAIVVALREALLLPLDDLLVVTREFIHSKASRSALHRLLKREGLSNLRKLIAEREGDGDEADKPEQKSFKDYEPGFIHIDLKYLPRMSDESSRRYLYAAIDRATRWVYVEVLDNKEANTAAGFLQRLTAKAPFKITRILTDNGKEFTDRYCATGERKPTGKHPFDKVCATHSIGHRLTKPRTPKTNGMVERFNGRIAEVIKTTYFSCSKELEETLLQYVRIYNQHIPQKALGHISPIQSLKIWAKSHPELFNNVTSQPPVGTVTKNIPQPARSITSSPPYKPWDKHR